ncbi:MAG: flavin oxidoreductase/NADH oxidase [Lentisphaerae bacterium]|nr:flavin oxidoreductase/NADH oxidase [Lentisphaerota bacterium]
MKCAESRAEFDNQMRAAGVALPVADDTSVLGEPVRLGRWTTPNRLVALPMEGCDASTDGTPGELAFRRYERMAAGGAGIIWLEACAVVPDGRSKPTAFWLHEKNVGVYRELVQRMRQAARAAMGHEILCILQLTHAGRYSRPDGTPKPVVAHHSPLLDAFEKLPADYPVVTDAWLDRLQDDFVRAARLAAAAGFDGVDVKACHGYLVSSLLGAHRREGRFGGDYANRTRLLKEMIARIRDDQPGLLLASRLNLFDGIAHPYGFGVKPGGGADEPDLGEPLRLARELADLGLPLLSVTLGFPRFDSRHGRPSADGRGENPLVGIARFARLAGAVQHAVPGMAIVNAALAWLGPHVPRVAAGLVAAGDARLIGQGRNSIAYPDAPRDLLRGAGFDPHQACVACSGCARLLRAGAPVGCIVRDRGTYGGRG